MTREDLINYKFVKMRIKRGLEEYERRFEAVTKTTSSIDGMPKAHNKPNYNLEDLLDFPDKIKEMYKDDLKFEEKLMNQLNKMTNQKYRTVLHLRYIVYPMEKNALEKTASEMNYSYNEVCKFNGEALNEFDKLDGKE